MSVLFRAYSSCSEEWNFNWAAVGANVDAEPTADIQSCGFFIVTTFVWRCLEVFGALLSFLALGIFKIYSQSMVYQSNLRDWCSISVMQLFLLGEVLADLADLDGDHNFLYRLCVRIWRFSLVRMAEYFMEDKKIVGGVAPEGLCWVGEISQDLVWNGKVFCWKWVSNKS